METVGCCHFSLAELVGLIDLFDAFTSHRGGRPPIPATLAIRRLYQMGIEGEFSLKWVERLIQGFGLYPVGSLVELNTGEQGWVIDVNQADSISPTIKVLWGPGHSPLAHPVVLQCSEGQSDGIRRKIQRVLNPFDVGCSPGYTLDG